MSRQFIADTLFHLDAIEARDRREAGQKMNYMEQWILGMILQLLHAVKFDPTRLPHLKPILLDIYDGIGALLGLPMRTPGA